MTYSDPSSRVGTTTLMLLATFLTILGTGGLLYGVVIGLAALLS